MDSPEEVEILHMTRRVQIDGEIWDREFSWMSDHTVYSRVGKNGAWGSWFRVPECWQQLGELMRLADKMQNKGWEVTWHPAYQPLLSEFAKSVSFS